MARYKGDVPSGLPPGTIVDDDVREWASKYSWHIKDCKKSHGGKYVKRSWKDGKNCGSLLHREIVGAKPGEIVDHISGDTMDNRRANLRIVSPSGNSQNQNKLRGDNKSGFRGVHFAKRLGKWIAYSRVNGKRVHLGVFNSAIEADVAARKFREANHIVKPT